MPRQTRSRAAKKAPDAPQATGNQDTASIAAQPKSLLKNGAEYQLIAENSEKVRLAVTNGQLHFLSKL